MQTAKQAIYSANVAKARLVYYKNKDTYKIVIAFNVTQTNKKGQLMFPVQAKCNFVSGDISYATLQADTKRIIDTAKATLRTDNIVFV